MIAYIDVRDPSVRFNKTFFEIENIKPKEDFIYYRRSYLFNTVYHENPKYEDWMYPYLLTRDYRGQTLLEKINSKNRNFYKNFGKTIEEAFENLYNDPSVREIIKLENSIFKELFIISKKDFMTKKFFYSNFEVSEVTEMNKTPYYKGYFFRLVSDFNIYFKSIANENSHLNNFRPNPRYDIRKVKFYPQLVYAYIPSKYSKVESYFGFVLNAFRIGRKYTFIKEEVL